MYDPSIWSNDLADGRRQYVVSVLTTWNGGDLYIKDLAKIVGDLADEPVPAEYLKDNKVFHGTRYRRYLSGDIDALNRDARFPFAIISDTRCVRICTKDECKRLYAMERHEALKKLAKCEKIARKANLDHQITVTREEIISFMEDANDQ